LSHRSTKPFITVNCGAIPAELVENELFGHAPGAFTGANSVQQGVVEEADEGTLFLDEIDCLPIASQVKLLRFLQEHEYKRLGSTKVCHADLRIIAATNSELEKEVQEGRFRRDLYYRLNVVPIVLPPLRERKEDIPTLARHFLEKYAYEFGKKMSDFSREAIGLMLAYKWPGNVRELENAVERAVIFAKGPVIERDDIILPYAVAETPDTGSFKKAKARAISQFERGYIEDLLLVNQGNIAKAARAAQKNRRAFWELIRRHGIDVEAFRRAAECPMVEQPQRLD
jgi:two-component system response regulator GlrR